MTDANFAKVPEWVLDAVISDRAVRLYAVLARYTRGRRTAWPSKATLAARMHCSGRAVERATDELVAIGAAALVSPVGMPNRYRLFDMPTFIERPVGRRKRTTCDTTVAPGTTPPATPLSLLTGATCDTGVVPPATDSVTTCDTRVAQKESKEEGELLKESPPLSSSRARTNGSPSSNVKSADDDDRGGIDASVKYDATIDSIVEAQLELVRSEMAANGEVHKFYDGTGKAWRRDTRKTVEKTYGRWVRAYIDDDPTITAEAIVAMVDPDLAAAAGYPADLDGNDDWMAEQRNDFDVLDPIADR